MDALWLISGQPTFYLVPDNQLILNKQGGLLTYAAACEESATTPEDMQALFIQSEVMILVATEQMFDADILSRIPPSLPKIGLFMETTPNEVREQLSALGIDAFTSISMNQHDYSSVLKKVSDDKKALATLQDEIKNYTDIAFTAMSSASEMGVVTVYAEKIQSVMDLTRLAQLTFSSLGDLGVQGVIQFTFDDEIIHYPKDASASYKFLLESAINSETRIVSKGRFLLFSFTQVQLLITDAPQDDLDRCGRLRDLLAQIVSIAESRAKTLKVNKMLKNQQENARMVMMLLDMAAKDNRNSVKEIMMDLSMSLRSMAMGMDLTLEQETNLLGLAEKALNSLEGLQEATAAVEEHFRSLMEQLDGAASLLEQKGELVNELMPEAEVNNVELF